MKESMKTAADPQYSSSNSRNAASGPQDSSLNSRNAASGPREDPVSGTMLVSTDKGLTLQKNGQTYLGDFTRMLPRLRQANLQEELLLRAARIRNADRPLRALDATAGMGEDALILAAGGFRVDLYENDPVVAALLRDALKRAAGEEIPEEEDRGEKPEGHMDEDALKVRGSRITNEMVLKSAVSRMTLHEEDSIEAMRHLEPVYDVIYLDPMFPAREKSALVKKKFQLIHELEKPCRDEEALLSAAMALRPLKLVIKRPLKGAYLAGRKPDYTLKGKAIRYDCFVFAREKQEKSIPE